MLAGKSKDHSVGASWFWLKVSDWDSFIWQLTTTSLNPSSNYTRDVSPMWSFQGNNINRHLPHQKFSFAHICTHSQVVAFDLQPIFNLQLQVLLLRLTSTLFPCRREYFHLNSVLDSFKPFPLFTASFKPQPCLASKIVPLWSHLLWSVGQGWVWQAGLGGQAHPWEAREAQVPAPPLARSLASRHLFFTPSSPSWAGPGIVPWLTGAHRLELKLALEAGEAGSQATVHPLPPSHPSLQPPTTLPIYLQPPLSPPKPGPRIASLVSLSPVLTDLLSHRSVEGRVAGWARWATDGQLYHQLAPPGFTIHLQYKHKNNTNTCILYIKTITNNFKFKSVDMRKQE